MFTSTPPRSSIGIGTDEHQQIAATGAAAVTLQRKRARSADQKLLFEGQLFHQGHDVNNDIIASDEASSSSSAAAAANQTAAMVSPFNNIGGGMVSSSSSPMTTTRLEPLIECAPNEELSETYTKHIQQQQQLPLSQASLVSTTNSIATFASSSILNNESIFSGGNCVYSDYHQPPMKRVKMDQEEGGNDQDFQEVVVPHEDCNDEEMSHYSSVDPQPANKSSSNSLLKLMVRSGNNTNASAATFSKINDSSCSSSSGGDVVCCHVCGGQGDDGATKQSGLNRCTISNSGGGNCATSRSIASYFQVTKKQPLTSSNSNSKLTSQPSSSSRKVSSLHNSATTTTTPNYHNQHLLPPCRYCDRPTCSTNPSCIKQCEECQHNFCSFCCKVNYDGMYEKTVCFECEELWMLSHCCDRMEL